MKHKSKVVRRMKTIGEMECKPDRSNGSFFSYKKKKTPPPKKKKNLMRSRSELGAEVGVLYSLSMML